VLELIRYYVLHVEVALLASLRTLTLGGGTTTQPRALLPDSSNYLAASETGVLGASGRLLKCVAKCREKALPLLCRVPSHLSLPPTGLSPELTWTKEKF
jgi:hypothetical protein